MAESLRSPADRRLPAHRNSVTARLAGGLVKTFEALSLRGAPTVLNLFSKAPFLQRQTATVRLGERWITFPAFDHYWSRYLWSGIPYEPEIDHIFRKLGKDSVLLDCGANIGYWCARAPEFGFREVRAIEANGALIPFIQENFRINGVAGSVHHAAVFSKSGEHLFLDKTASHAQGSLGDKGVPVDSITIADLVKDLPADQEVIAKLDVEGAEIAAIDGASGVDRIIFVYEDFGKLGMPVSEELLKRNYAVIGVRESGEHCRISSLQDAFAFNAVTHTPGGASNLLVCDQRRAAELEAALSAPAR